MVTFLTLYIVPRMSDLFKSLSAQRGLPTITVVVLAISKGVAGNIWWIAPLVLIVFGGLIYVAPNREGQADAAPPAFENSCRRVADP